MAYSQPFPLAQGKAAPQLQPTYGPDLSVRLICPDCRDPNPNIVEEFGSGDLVCGSCGLVLGDRIVDTRSEWRVSRCFLDLFTCPNRILLSFLPIFCSFICSLSNTVLNAGARLVDVRQ